MPERERSCAQTGQSVRILPVPLSGEVICRHLGPIHGTLLHWHKGRSVPCQGPDKCNSAVHKDRPVWAGYGAVEAWERVSRLWIPFVLELTGHGEEFIRGRELRGETWLWSREGEGGKRAPVIGVFCEKIAEDSCRPCFDVAAVLARFFNPWKVILGAANPTPPRVVLEASPGPAPNLPAELQPAPAEQASPRDKRNIRERWEQQAREKAQREQGQAERNGRH